MIQKKICMLGAFAVGKTSLVSRYVKSIFSDKYHTTVGVKIDKKLVKYGSEEVNMLLWDLAGEDEFQKVRMSYLRGSSGYILVIDGTRLATLETALMLQKGVIEAVGDIPFVVVINKADLVDEWDVEEEQIQELEAKGWSILKGSAKTGEGVEEAFATLVEKMLGV